MSFKRRKIRASEGVIPVRVVNFEKSKEVNTAIHVWSDGEYIGNIMFYPMIPEYSEEELEDAILENFPQLKGKQWNLEFN